jgi:hypothetical protein
MDLFARSERTGLHAAVQTPPFERCRSVFGPAHRLSELMEDPSGGYINGTAGYPFLVIHIGANLESDSSNGRGRGH